MEQLDNLIWVVYLLDVILEIEFFGLGWLFLGTIIPFVVVFFWMLCYNEIGYNEEECSVFFKEKCELVFKNKVYYTFVFLCLVGWLLNTFLPSKDTAYKMLAVYAGVEVIKQPEVQELGGKGVEVLNKLMDDYLDKPTKEGKQ